MLPKKDYRNFPPERSHVLLTLHCYVAGPFTVWNEANEAATLQRWFEHMQQVILVIRALGLSASSTCTQTLYVKLISSSSGSACQFHASFCHMRLYQASKQCGLDSVSPVV